MPHDFGWATIVHGRRPDGKDSVLWVKSAIAEESGVLSHTVGEGHIVILAPATERVEEQDWVPVALCDELFTGVLKQEHMTIMERVSDLEGVNDIGVLLNDLGLDLGWGHSVLIVAIVEDGADEEVHGLSTDEEVSLSEDGLGAWVLLGHAAEGAGADLLLAVVEEDWLVDDGEDLVAVDSGALDGDSGLTLEGGLLLGSHRLGDGHREEVASALSVGESLHVHDLEELELVHEAVEGCGPTITDGLEVLDLVLGDVKDLEAGDLFSLVGGGLLPERLGDDTLLSGAKDTLLGHVVDDEGLGGHKGELTSVHVEGRVGWGLIRVRDTSEVGDDTGAGLLVESLDVTALTDLEGGADVALVELEAGSLVDLLGEVSVGGVWGDEGDEDNLTGEAEQLGDLSDTADILLAVVGREAEVLVETGSDDITVKEEDLLVVANKLVNLLLEGTGEGGLTGTRETSEPVGGTGGDDVSGVVVGGVSFDHCV